LLISARKERRDENYDSKVGRIALRAQALGYDRNFRRYWWILGESGYLLVEDGGDRWGWYDTIEKVQELLQCLDIRGIREKSLKGKLRKKQAKLIAAMKSRHRVEEREVLEKTKRVRRSSRIKQKESDEKGYKGYVNSFAAL